MKKTDNTTSASKVLGFPILTGLVLTLVLMLVGAALVYGGKIDESFIPQIAIAILGLGGFLSALLAARRAPRSRLLWGLAAGGILFLCLLLLSLVWIGEPIRIARVVLVLAVTMVAGFAGGLASSNVKKRRRKRK